MLPDLAPDLIIVAAIVRPHGRRGEVVLKPHTDALQTLLTSPSFYLVPGPDGPVRVEGARLHKGVCLLKLEKVDSIDQAGALAGRTLRLPRAQLRPLEKGEYFLHDLVGISVMGRDGRTVGTVEWVLETGGPPVLVGRRPGGDEFMVPFASPLVREIDMGARTMRIDEPDGLWELPSE